MKTMKFLMGLLLVALSIGAQAQFGVKIGGAGSQMGEYSKEYVNFGFVGGIYDQINLGKVVSLTPEVTYIGKGGLSHLVPGDKMKLHYLQGNLLLGVGFLRVGGYASKLFLVEHGHWTKNRPDAWLRPDKSAYGDWDFGLIGGINIPLRGVNLDLQYQHGTEVVINGKKNRAVAITLEVPFRL